MVIKNRILSLYRKIKLKVFKVNVYEYDYSFPPKSDSVIKDTLNKKSGFPKIDSKARKRRIAFYITEKNEVVHVSWVFLNNLLAKQLRLKNVIVIGDCLTIENYRGKGLYGKTINHIVSIFPERKAILFIDPENKSSIKGAEKSGFACISKYTIYRFLGLAYKIIKYA